MDNESSDDEDDDDEDEDVPKLVQVKEKKAAEKMIDDDGFEMVTQKKGRRGRN